MDGSLFVRVNMGFLDRRLSSRARARVDTRARGDDRRAAVTRERDDGNSRARRSMKLRSGSTSGETVRERALETARRRRVARDARAEASALETALETSSA